jgi:hypothetical protein
VLPGEQSLVEVQVPAFQQPSIGWDKISGDQFDNVGK